MLNRVQFEYNVTAMVLNSTDGPIGAVMRDSVVSSNLSNGILSIAGQGTSFTIERSSLLNNVGNAIQSNGANSLVTIHDSTITGNQVGLSFINGGGIQSAKNNLIFGNGTNGTPVGGIALQ